MKGTKCGADALVGRFAYDKTFENPLWSIFHSNVAEYSEPRPSGSDQSLASSLQANEKC